MTSNSIEKIGPRQGVILRNIPKVPIVSSIPNTSLNIVKRSEIVASPAKGINNLGSISNNQASSSICDAKVYLDDREKNQNKSITSSNFNSKNILIDELREKLGEALRRIQEVFVEESGRVREEICGELEEDVSETLEYLRQIVTIGRKYKESARGEVATQNVTPRESDYCHLAGKIAEKCYECEANKDINYCCDRCETCKEERKLMGQAKNYMHKKIYVEKEKERIIGRMKQEKPEERMSGIIAPMNNIAKELMVTAQFNRIGNFVDKFLAVTYTAADTDVIEVEGKTRGKRMENIERQLVDNFMKLTEIRDMPSKGYIYVIEYTKAMVPHLHGLVRMSGEKIGKSISATDTRFTGKNKIMIKSKGEGRQDDGKREEKLKMLLKPINVAGWIEYMKKMWIITGKIEFKGKMEGVTEGWEYKEAEAIYPF